MNSCQFKIIRGSRKGQDCGNQSAKLIGDKYFCYKHAKSKPKKVIELKDDPVFNDSMKKEDRTPKVKKSVFAITIVSNNKYSTLGDSEKLKFKQIIEYLCNTNNAIKYLKSSFGEINKDNIINFDIDFSFE